MFFCLAVKRAFLLLCKTQSVLKTNKQTKISRLDNIYLRKVMFNIFFIFICVFINIHENRALFKNLEKIALKKYLVTFFVEISSRDISNNLASKYRV